ncbi:MAG: ATP-grasp domain-containing protein [Planctomycetes bacterium]|nr:ATP-grasp domain-containing protein [Planctomycetota bacterium]
MPTLAFVLPFVFDTSLRFLRAALAVPGLRVGVISSDPLARFGPEIAASAAGHWQVENPLDAGQIVTAVEGLGKLLGPVEGLIGVLEELQVPLAEARETLGLPGMRVEAAHNFRDKARMKDVLRAAGVPCARHCLAHSVAEAEAFLAEVDLPVVIKPQAGAGAKNTFRLDRPEQVADALAAFPPSAERPTLLEEFVVGREHSFDSVCLKGKLLWASVSHYHPTPLEVLQHDWIQWCVLLPRDVSGEEYAPIREAGAQALAALGMETGMSHLEWFRREDGSVVVSEVAARPPGAQITTLLSYAYDTDMYQAWARLVGAETFDPPERRYAVGAAYLRGQGSGSRVVGVRGLELAQQEVGELVVEAKLPQRGQSSGGGYEGQGYVIVRHPETSVVERALQTIVRRVRVELG